MSTTVRILILVGVLVISIISYLICIRLGKKIDDNTKHDHVIIIPNIFYGIALIIGIVLLFSYHNRTFLTIEKIVWISTIFLGMDVVTLGVFIMVYEMFNKKK